MYKDLPRSSNTLLFYQDFYIFFVFQRTKLGTPSKKSFENRYVNTSNNVSKISKIKTFLPQDCLARSFRAEVYSCPMCRAELGKDYAMKVNHSLQSALSKIFPGYENGR